MMRLEAAGGSTLAFMMRLEASVDHATFSTISPGISERS